MKRLRPVTLALRLALQITLLPVVLGACTATQTPPAVNSPVANGPDLQATAAAQATAIIQQAQATALVLHAQAQATALVANAFQVSRSPTQGKVETPGLTPRQMDPSQLPTTEKSPKPGAASTPTGEGLEVEIIQVGYAAEGGFIMVSFRADPDIAGTFWPGQLSVTDEGSGIIYNEVPVMPTLGPLISRPTTLGQVGYVMFVNAPPGLKPGSLVTVILAKYTFEHLKIE